MYPGSDQARAHGDSIDETRTGRAEVEGAGIGRAKQVLHIAGAGGTISIGRQGGEDDGVEIFGRKPGPVEGHPRGLQGEIAG